MNNIERLSRMHNDLNELHNLALNSDYLDIMETLKAKLEKWMNDTDDFVISGTNPKPTRIMGFEQTKFEI